MAGDSTEFILILLEVNFFFSSNYTSIQKIGQNVKYLPVKNFRFYIILFLLQLLPKEVIDNVHIDTDPLAGIYVPDGSKSFVHTCTH